MDERVGGSGNVAGAGAGYASAPVLVRDLVKTYGAIKAVDHISFKLEPATTVALLGGNGAGKTTTIAMLLGLVMPTAGEVRVFGADMARDRGAVAHRMNFQSPYVDLPMRLTVRENLTVYSGLYGVANKEERIAYVADDLQIEPLLDRPTGKLSAGQKTRVGLAKALLNAPELLLLDEPTAGINPVLIESLIDRLKAANKERGLTLLVIEHNMPVIMGLAEHIYCLAHGKLLAEGPPQKIKRDAKVLDAYLGAA
jgi:ABC-2 type transport system ATP-binding protein